MPPVLACSDSPPAAAPLAIWECAVSYPTLLDLILVAGLAAELLEYGAIADQKNDKGKTPLDKAIEHELDYRPKHSGARHSSHIVQLLEDALGGKREDL
eukprot:COSAG04_NODE_29_length_36122_cov_73.422619_15_plen_99_part_00